MATGKKSFVLYCDQREIFEQLPLEKRGELITILFKYVNDENPIIENDPLLNMAFTLIKGQLKRDLKKYEARAERSRENGSLGGRPPKLEEPKKPNGLINNPEEPKKPDTDTVTVTVNDNVNDIYHTHETFIEWFNECRKFIGLKSNIKILTTIEKQNFNQIKDLYTKEDFKKAFKNFSSAKYYKDNELLFPSCFLKLDTFTKYLNAEVKQELTLGQKLNGKM